MRLYELILGSIALIGTIAAASCTGCGEGYSEGERVGTVTKLSRKGLVFKSWEGQMNLGGSVPSGDGGFVANTWNFHASERMAQEIQTYMEQGVPVRIKYEEWLKAPMSQDSSYDVIDVKPLESKAK